MRGVGNTGGANSDGQVTGTNQKKEERRPSSVEGREGKKSRRWGPGRLGDKQDGAPSNSETEHRGSGAMRDLGFGTS